MKTIDLVVRVTSQGFIPIILDDTGKEISRGEFKKTPEEALTRCINEAKRRELL